MRELPYNGEAGCIDGRMQCREHHAAAVEPFEWCVRHFQKEMRAKARANWMLGLCCDWRGIGTRPSVHAADQCKAAAVEECSSQLICCWLLRRCARLRPSARRRTVTQCHQKTWTMLLKEGIR